MKLLRQTFRRSLKFIRNDLRGELQRYLPLRAENRLVQSYDGDGLGDCSFLVSTKNGFLLLHDGHIKRLLPGQFFGISRCGDCWYVFQRLSYRSGRIVQFKLDAGRMVDARQVISGLSPGCHQIDFLDSQLYVMDTYNNRVLVYSQASSDWRLQASFYPNGELENGRNSKNYAHMNSIWRDGSDIWLMFHNETVKSGKHSEIVRLDAEHQVAETIATQGRNAHNVLMIDGQFLFCDSMNNTLVWGDREVYRSEFFTRGLSVTEDYVVVGHSPYGAREIRDELGGSLAVLDRQFNLLRVISTPGMVQDIRAVDKPDEGMSNTVRQIRPGCLGAR